MKYIAVLDTDEIEDFAFFEDGKEKYLHGIDANSVNGEWIYLPFKPLEQEPFKPMVEIDLYSVIKQKYIEREVLDKIRAEIKHFMYDVNPSSSESDYACNYILQIIDKYKAEKEQK